MTRTNATRTVRWLLIPTIILVALTVLTAHAQAGDPVGEPGPDEWDVTERYCAHPPILLGNSSGSSSGSPAKGGMYGCVRTLCIASWCKHGSRTSCIPGA
jgi:hypothetical protein